MVIGALLAACGQRTPSDAATDTESACAADPEVGSWYRIDNTGNTPGGELVLAADCSFAGTFFAAQGTWEEDHFYGNTYVSLTDSTGRSADILVIDDRALFEMDDFVQSSASAPPYDPTIATWNKGISGGYANGSPYSIHVTYSFYSDGTARKTGVPSAPGPSGFDYQGTWTAKPFGFDS